jgi:uncharacterized protein YndB with AHSA1/START domain
MPALKIVARVAVACVAVVALVLLVTALLPRTFAVERDVVIERPGAEVFDYLRHLKHQPEFSKWSRIDPAMTTTLRGTDGAVGCVYAWSSDHPDVGAGELEITSLDPGKRLAMEIRITKPFRSTDPTSITLEPDGDGRTRVRQVYHGKMPYPMNLMCSVACRAVGDGMEESLRNLKGVLERKRPDEEANGTR